MVGRSSYSTLIRSKAAVATSSSTAAIAATGSPTIRTLPMASACSSSLTGMAPYAFGRSCPVSTALTPGYLSALEASSDRMRAWGAVLRNSLAWSMRGNTISSAYFVSPVHLAVASTLRRGLPTTRSSGRWLPLLPAINALPGSFRRFARHPGGGQLHCLVDLDIAGAAANVSRESRLDLIARRPRNLLQQGFCRQEHSGSAVSTLRGAK